jgi:hypothetical protein
MLLFENQDIWTCIELAMVDFGLTIELRTFAKKH